jgi:hypothetical protein
MEARRLRPTKRTRRHFGAGVGCDRDRIAVLYDAVDDQAGGNKGGNPKIGGHGGDSFKEITKSSAKIIEIESDPNLNADFDAE